MDKTFKKEFIINGLAAHVRRRLRCKNSVNYEIRYRRNGYDITAYGTTLEIAKENFLKATSPQNIEKYRRKEAVVTVWLSHLIQFTQHIIPSPPYHKKPHKYCSALGI